MGRQTLYAYVEEADLQDIAASLERRFTAFVEGRRWVASNAWVVNQQHGQETCTQPGDLPLWDLGLNLSLPDVGSEPSEWFSDIEAVARFLGALHREHRRNFVIGIADPDAGISEDLFFVTGDSPDMESLRRIIGTDIENDRA